VKITTSGIAVSSVESTKSGFELPMSTWGASFHSRRNPGNVIRSVFPVCPGTSFTVAPNALTRSVNTWRKCSSRWDSIVSTPGGSSVSSQSHACGTAASGTPAVSNARRCRSAASRATCSTCQGGAKGSRQRWHASRPCPPHSQVATMRHARYSRSHTRSGSASSARYPVPPGTVSCSSSASATFPPPGVNTGSVISVTSRWSGLPPICSRSPSSSAADSDGIAKESPSVTVAGRRTTTPWVCSVRVSPTVTACSSEERR